MLFILVQIQAGPPRFALTGYAWRSHARPAGQACPAKLECNESEDGLVAKPNERSGPQPGSPSYFPEFPR